jgi:hypothetical protein
VDVTIAEVLGQAEDGGPRLGGLAIFEIQTADFHGSPLLAIRNLRRLGPPTRTQDYHAAIADNAHQLGERVDGRIGRTSSRGPSTRSSLKI